MDTAQRTVARVQAKTHLGPDAQVDDKNLIISPERPDLTDPFLVLSEDWFSSPGFNWHPHRGVWIINLVVLTAVLEAGWLVHRYGLVSHAWGGAARTAGASSQAQDGTVEFARALDVLAGHGPAR